jgi:glycosyltransferase involved in cell wall biosynthesis
MPSTIARAAVHEKAWTLCVSTQTPLLQFSKGHAALGFDEDVRAHAREGEDFRFSPGGVTRMVWPLLSKWHERRRLRASHWISLNPKAPPRVRIGETVLHHVDLPARRLGPYGSAKETIWGTVHGTEVPDRARDLFWSDSFSEYAYYNRLVAERMRELDATEDFDLFYVHDFQQLAVGEMVGGVKPKLLRWHIPFEPDILPSDWDVAFRNYMGAFDTVVVSAKKYVRAARPYARRVEVVYPYIDPADYSQPSHAEVARIAESFGIDPSDDVILVVARMDPMKGQDLALEGFSQLAKRHPQARLVLVGNGSFSNSQAGAISSKGSRWRARLEAEARRLGVAKRVLFTGHVDQGQLDALYERALFTLLPSVREGFGLVVAESWLHGKPALVTQNAGIAEILGAGSERALVDPTDVPRLADRMEWLLQDIDARRHLAIDAAQRLPLCTIECGLPREERLLGRHLDFA